MKSAKCLSVGPSRRFGRGVCVCVCVAVKSAKCLLLLLVVVLFYVRGIDWADTTT